MKDDTFTIDCQDVTRCSRAGTPTITVPEKLWFQLGALCREVDSEWFAYLVGRLSEDGLGATITDFYFPVQSAGGAHVHVIDDLLEVKPGTIGALHSHVNMSASFSHIDKQHSNWPVEIVMNRKDEYEANLRVKLPCGAFMRADAKIDVAGEDVARLTTLVNAALLQGSAYEEKSRPTLELEPQYSFNPHWPDFDGGEALQSVWRKKSRREGRAALNNRCVVRGCANPANATIGRSKLCVVHVRDDW